MYYLFNRTLMIDFSIWAFPVSLILAVAFVLALVLAWSYCKRSKAIGFLAGQKMALAVLLPVAVLVAVEGTWKLELYHHWGFLGFVLLLSLSLGLVVLQDQCRKQFSAAFFSHVGMFLLLVSGFFGAPDVSDSQLVVTREEPQHLSYTFSNRIVPLPFSVQLEDFRIDYYDDGVSPKQYTSMLLVDGVKMQTSVNHPCSYKGYDIYQMDYDAMGQRYSVLKVVHDPWLYGVYAGMVLLMMGACMEVRKTWHSRAVLPVILVLTAAFSFLSVARINFGTLMPALRSLWFVPHLIVYMIAYSLLAIASVLVLVPYLRRKISVDAPRKLLVTSSALLLTGMLCGAVWAKAVWGQYWTWDAKECWAAATWLLTLVGLHLPVQWVRKRLGLIIWLAFLAMQITWYGVNYLPSAIYSLHTYNN